MADLSIYLTTFNCGRALIDIDYFAANLFNGFKSELPPDLIVLSLQEIGPLGYSFLGGSYLAPYFSRFDKAIFAAAASQFEGSNDYLHLTTRNLGMTAIMVFARARTHEKIRWVETGGVGVGLWEMGNKGAVGVRLGLQVSGDETVLTFVAAHLAPMEEAWKRRNEDWKSICEALVFEREGSAVRQKLGENSEDAEPLLSSSVPGGGGGGAQKGSMFKPASHLFLAGDLNYRTSDHRPDPAAHGEWPQPVPSASESRHYSQLLKHDQLTRERNKKHTLHNLSEAPIAFPPTYKYSIAAQKQAADPMTRTKPSANSTNGADGTVEQRSDVEDEVWLWAQHRMPSWCDRILFLSQAQPEVHSYTVLPVQPTSDHRPVALSCSVPFEPVGERVEPPFAVRRDWRERRATARRLEILVGIAAYLSLTWEGEALLAGTVVGLVGGYLVLRALVYS